MKLKTFEVICITVGLLSLLATGATAVLGDESAPVGAGLTLAAIALLYLAVMGWKLRKQEVAFWCSPESGPVGRRRFHNFKEIVDTEKTRIWECSVCGVHRQVMSNSGDNTAH